MATVFRTLVPKKVDRGRVDFRPEDFRRLVLTKGMPLRWEMAARCPCSHKTDRGGVTLDGYGEPAPDCPVCYGRGIDYHSPQEITGVYMDATLNPDRFKAFGENAEGAAAFTMLPEHTPGFLDRITMTENVMVYAEVRERLTAETTMRLGWPIVTRNIVVGTELDPTESEVLPLGVTYCRKAGRDGLVYGPQLVEGTDFEITDDGELDWTLGIAAGTAPAVGDLVSVTYYSNPTYVVQRVPFGVRDTLVSFKHPSPAFYNLPRAVFAWLEYMGRPEWPQGVE